MLIMKFPPSYPEQQPVIDLRNPRGLGEDFIANTLKLCHEKCLQFSGSPVIYEIIEVRLVYKLRSSTKNNNLANILIQLIRECLTNSNRPTGHCTICLFDFHPDDIFTYTPCYHHFHSHCLSRFCQSLKDQWQTEEEQEAVNNPSGANWKEKQSKQVSVNLSVYIGNKAISTRAKVCEHLRSSSNLNSFYFLSSSLI